MLINLSTSNLIKMVPEDIMICSSIAKTMLELKKNSSNTKNYQKGVDNGSLLPEEEAFTRSSLAERAVAYMLEKPWNNLYANRYHYIYGKNTCDVGDNVEVRTMRTNFKVPVKTNERDGLVIYGCAVSDDYEWVEVFGSITSELAKNPKYYIQEQDFTGYRVPLEDLTPPPPIPNWLAVVSA